MIMVTVNKPEYSDKKNGSLRKLPEFYRTGNINQLDGRCPIKNRSKFDFIPN